MSSWDGDAPLGVEQKQCTVLTVRSVCKSLSVKLRDADASSRVGEEEMCCPDCTASALMF